MALKKLRLAQPGRDIFFWSYEGVIERPDDAQREMANRFGLSIIRRYPEIRELSTGSIGKWQRNEEYMRYLLALPPKVKAHIGAFCQEFGYNLPGSFTTDRR